MYTIAATYNTDSTTEQTDNSNNDHSYSSECPSVCPLYVSPICTGAESGTGKIRQFSNQCFLNIYNCNHPNNRKFLMLK